MTNFAPNHRNPLLPRPRPRVGIFHPWMSLGGSELTTVWALEALKQDCEITLITPAEFCLRELNFAFGTSLMPWEFSLLRIPPLPGMHSGSQLPRLRLNHFESHARKLAAQFDLCVSGYNPIDFGRPAIHLVGDFAWDQPFCDQLHSESAPLHAHHQTALYRSYGWLADHFFHWRSREIFHQSDLLLANSRWVARHLAGHYGVRNVSVLPPPVPMPPASIELRRDPQGFVWLGHITREKRFEWAVEILSGVRGRGHDVSLAVIGEFGADAYGKEMLALIADRPWIRRFGTLTGEEKWDVMRRQSFALHTNVAEAFGIGLAEMSACGCVPFVPADSGAVDLMADPALAFHSPNEAIERIDAVLRRPGAWDDLASVARERAGSFRPEVFVEAWRRLAAAFMQSQPALAA